MHLAEKSEITSGLLIKNSILNFTGQLILFPIVIITLPYIVHNLGAARFGIFAILKILVDYFGVCELGLGGATTKYIAQARGNNEIEKISRIYRTSLFFVILLGVIGTLIFYFTIPVLAGLFLKVETNLVWEMKTISRIGSLLVFVMLTKSLFSGVLEAYQRFDLVNILRIPYLVAINLIPVAAIYLGYGLIGVTVGIVGIEMLTLFGYYLMSRNLIPKKNLELLDFHSFMPILSFGLWLSVVKIVTWVMLNIQNILIGVLISAAAVTYYNVSYSLVNKMAMIGVSITPIVFSAMSLLYARSKERMPNLARHSLKYTAILYGLPVLIFIWFSKEILFFWMGEGFQQSVGVLKILAIGAFSCGIGMILGACIQGIGKPKVITISALFQLPIDILATWFLTRHFGILGAALAWSSMRIFTVIMYYIFCKSFNILNLNLKINLKSLQAAGWFGLLLVFISISKYYFHSSLGSLVLNVLILTIGYLSIAWQYMIDNRHHVLIKEKTGINKFLKLKSRN